MSREFPSIFTSLEKESEELAAVQEARLLREKEAEAAKKEGIVIKSFGAVDGEIVRLGVKRDKLLQNSHWSPDSLAIQELDAQIERLKRVQKAGEN